MHSLPIIIATLSLVIATAGFAAASNDQPTASPFQHGDRVCFIGDSITGGGLYHAYVQLFYSTRYPDRDITFFNCGHSGGASGDCLRRLSWDVLDRKPTVAMLNFGMNDMSGLYGDANTPTAEIDAGIAKRIAGVEVNYCKVLDQLSAAGVRLILSGPPVYDDTVSAETPLQRSNLAMTRWTKRIGEIADDRKAEFVDLGAVMNSVNTKLQAADPKATIVGPDRVHPGPVGQAVMAFAILEAQGVEPVVARIAVDAATGQPGELFNCEIEQIERNSESLRFTCLEKSLPLVLPDNAAPALALVPFTARLNQELLAVTNLPAGSHELRIDDTVVGIFTADELAAGVNLAERLQTPQAVQARAVAVLNMERNELERMFRTKAFIRHSLLDAAKIDPNDAAAVEQFIKARIDSKRPEEFGHTDHVARAYLTDVAPKWDERVRRHAEVMAKLAADRQPRPHHFSLTPAAKP